MMKEKMEKNKRNCKKCLLSLHTGKETEEYAKDGIASIYRYSGQMYSSVFNKRF